MAEKCETCAKWSDERGLLQPLPGGRELRMGLCRRVREGGDWRYEDNYCPEWEEKSSKDWADRVAVRLRANMCGDSEACWAHEIRAAAPKPQEPDYKAMAERVWNELAEGYDMPIKDRIMQRIVSALQGGPK